ncbi:MAG: HEAT repeat domain-containing protein [Desulfuromonadaceae bacterium]|nr:HEAT repeat domain-containing protein [Desulfuromonadaceae bacterium]MDD2854834.1 HEAT repeat domain-containing protein [Desulfuromonadaceae bacterium]
MFNLGRIIRQDDSNLFRSQCGSILNAANIVPGTPSLKVLTRPKHQKIQFGEEIISHPAFMVELDYWLSRAEFPHEKPAKSIHRSEVNDEQKAIDARTEAIYELRGIEFSASEELLLDAISDPNPQIRIAGLTVLSEYCSGKHLLLFENALNDNDEAVRRYAGEYLQTYRKHIRNGHSIKARLSVEDCIKALATPKDRERAIEDLSGVTDPRIIEPLLKIMRNEDLSFYCRTKAMDVLANIDCPALLEEFYSILGDEQLGETAAYKLRSKSEPIAQEMLRRAFYSDDRIARLSAAKCVIFSDNHVLQKFCQMLENIDLEYRKVAVDRISGLLFSRWYGEEQESPGNFKISDESVRLLVTAMKTTTNEENNEIRSKAIESLCLIDKIQGAPVLMEALEEFIHTALDENYQDKKDPWDYDSLQSSLHHGIAILENKSFCEPLVRLFDSKCWDVKLDAASSLLLLGDNRAITLLDEALNHEDWKIRIDAARILYTNGNSRMWDVLIKALSEDVEDNRFVKWGIIDTLAKSGDPRTVVVLCDILNNSGAYYLDDMDIGRVITCLGELGDPLAIESIKMWQYKELVNCQDDVVEQALRSLGAL